METKVDEIADKIYRFSTLIPGVAGPAGLTFNQFLIDADEPLLFHTGHAAAVRRDFRSGGAHHRSRETALDHLQPCRIR